MTRFVKRLCGWGMILPLLICATNIRINAATVKTAETQAPASDPADTIIVPDNTVLVLGNEGKYIFLNEANAAAAISESDWDTPVGYFTTQTKLAIGNSAFIRSVVPVGIQQIIGDETSELHIVSGSHIAVDTQKDIGIYTGSLVVGSPDSATASELSVSSGGTGINCFAGVTVNSGSLLTVTGVNYGICHIGPIYASGITLQAHPASRITATATGADGIAIKGSTIDAVACKIIAAAPQGKGGILLTESLVVRAEHVGDSAVRSIIEASSYSGRAVGVGYGELSGYIHVEGSVLRGVTQHGQAGVYAGYISATNSYEPYFPSEVFGSADVGFGVVGQMLDYDSEFPSGGINVTDSRVTGHVNEGMGISSFILSSHPSGAENLERSVIEGIAQKGLGISVCSGYIHQTDIIGKSYGATQKHFQVYDSIADSAGMNFLSYFHVTGDVTLTAEAPLEDPDSFGLHGLLNSADGSYRSGDLYINSYEEGTSSITAEGGIGMLFGGGLMLYSDNGQKIDVTAHGAVNGIETDRIHSISYGTVETPISINVLGDRGSGLTNAPKMDYNHYSFIMEKTSLRAEGEQYGVYFPSGMDFSVTTSSIDAAATGDGATATGFYIENPIEDQYAPSLYLVDSPVRVQGRLYGWHSKNVNLFIQKNLPLFHTNELFTATGEEIGLFMEFDEELSPDQILGLQLSNQSGIGNALVTAISDSIPPDRAGRMPAVSAPRIELSGAVTLLENYLHPISAILSETPYMAYAENQNIAALTHYDWKDSSIPVEASVGGLWTSVVQPNVFGQTLIGKRNDQLAGEIVELVSGSQHQVKMTTGNTEYTVTFEANGGIPAPTPQLVPSGGLVSIPETPIRSNDHFTGWFQEEELTDAWNFPTDPVLSDMTLYAGWEMEQISPRPILPDKNITPTQPSSGNVTHDQQETKTMPPNESVPLESIPGSENNPSTGASAIPLYSAFLAVALLSISVILRCFRKD